MPGTTVSRRTAKAGATVKPGRGKAGGGVAQQVRGRGLRRVHVRPAPLPRRAPPNESSGKTAIGDNATTLYCAPSAPIRNKRVRSRAAGVEEPPLNEPTKKKDKLEPLPDNTCCGKCKEPFTSVFLFIIMFKLIN